MLPKQYSYYSRPGGSLPLYYRYILYGFIAYKTFQCYDKLKAMLALQQTKMQLVSDRSIKLKLSTGTEGLDMVSSELIQDVIMKRLVENEDGQGSQMPVREDDDAINLS